MALVVGVGVVEGETEKTTGPAHEKAWAACRLKISSSIRRQHVYAGTQPHHGLPASYRAFTPARARTAGETEQAGNGSGGACMAEGTCSGRGQLGWPQHSVHHGAALNQSNVSRRQGGKAPGSRRRRRGHRACRCRDDLPLNQRLLVKPLIELHFCGAAVARPAGRRLAGAQVLQGTRHGRGCFWRDGSRRCCGGPLCRPWSKCGVLFFQCRLRSCTHPPGAEPGSQRGDEEVCVALAGNSCQPPTYRRCSHKN